MEAKKDLNLYFKNGKPRKHPKKVKQSKDEQQPVSVVQEVESKNMYHNHKVHHYTDENGKRLKEDCNGSKYEPPLPTSVVKQEPEPEPEPDKLYIPPKMRSNDNVQIFNADCLEKMKDLENDSVDLIFCDLPYGQTSCKWDCKIDLDVFWKEVMRIKKLNTPIFFTTTTKFGVDLIQSAPKRCMFRYDLVWVKSAPAGFLSAKKMPMRKHEMVYLFYEKLPFYDLSSHTHKFIKANIKNEPTNKKEDDLYGIESGNAGRKKGFHQTKYEPPLPVSVVKQVIKGENNTYNTEGRKKPIVREKAGKYETPLPTTMLEIKSTRGKHSTEKPVALMEWILKYYSKPGDTILDPTMGSGSTGVACINMNRKFIGIEMDPDIFKTAETRLNIC